MTGSLSGRGVDGSTVCEVFVYRRSGELTVDALAEYARGRSVIAGVGPGEDCGVPGTVVLRVAVDNDTGSVLRTDSSGLLDASDHVDVWLTQLARHLGVSVDYGDGSVIRPNGDEVELDTPERPGSVRRVVLWDQDCVYDAVLCADGVGVPLWLGSWPGVTALLSSHPFDVVSSHTYLARDRPIVALERRGRVLEVSWFFRSCADEVHRIVVGPDLTAVLSAHASMQARAVCDRVSRVAEVVFADVPRHARTMLASHPVAHLHDRADEFAVLGVDLFLHRVVSLFDLPGAAASLITTHLSGVNGVDLRAQEQAGDLVRLAPLPEERAQIIALAAFLHNDATNRHGLRAPLSLRLKGTVWGQWGRAAGYGVLLLLCVGLVALTFLVPGAHVIFQLVTLAGVGIYIYLTIAAYRDARAYQQVQEEFLTRRKARL